MGAATLLYIVHRGQLYGAERMALTTSRALSDRFHPLLFAPPGPLHEAAAGMGISSCVFSSVRDLARQLPAVLKRCEQLACVATGVGQSLAFHALNTVWRRPCVHIQMVHGGIDDRQGYGNKRWLNPLPITQVAVSEYVRGRLLSSGVRDDRIQVIENCLPAAQLAATRRRPAFARDGIGRVAIVSRIDPAKRVGMILGALDRARELGRLRIDVYGGGWELDTLRVKGSHHPNLRFHGFVPNVHEHLAEADLLLHLCPEEPFGMPILEAMAAGVPVLVPDQGGAGSLVCPGINGFRFRGDDLKDLIRALRELTIMPAERLNSVREGGFQCLTRRFSEAACMNAYRALLSPLSV